MEGYVVNYRRSLHNARTNQFVIEVKGVETKAKAAALIGKKAVWTGKEGKAKIGNVTRVHGNKGKVVARFATGLPGQAIGTKIKVA